MAYVNLPYPICFLTQGPLLEQQNSATMNAAGNSAFTVGRLYLPGQTGTKVLSAAGGGRIYWISGPGNTFANAASELRVGIQDVSSGLPDGTFDVYSSYVGGTDTIGNQVVHDKAMTSGSKTMANGALIAIGHTLVTRGGADTVATDRLSLGSVVGNYGYPYGTANGSRTAACPPYLIRFDDGTPGWVHPLPLLYNMSLFSTLITYNSGSTPDEYIGTFSFAVPMRVTAVGVNVLAIGPSDPFDVILYTDPYGTPAPHETVSFTGSADFTDGMGIVTLATPYDLQADTKIGVAVRPTSTNNIQWSHLGMGSGFDYLKQAQPFATVQMASRTNQSGAFVETQAYHLPDIVVWVSAVDNGASTGGGSTAVTPIAIGPRSSR